MNVLNLKEQDYEKVETNSDSWLSLENLKNEYWRDIIDFEGLYQVSNYGRVKSLKRKVHANIKYNDKITKKECVLRQYKKHDKYWGVALCKNGKHYNKRVHILVASAFLKNKDNKKCIDHIKEVTINNCNNCLYNLRYATHKENTLHAKENNRLKQPKEHYRQPILKYYNNIVIKEYDSIRECSKNENISRTTLYKLLDKNKRYKNGYMYKRKRGDVNHEDNIK